MPIPYAIARFNRVGLNRLTKHLAPYIPGFGVVLHRGRRSGRTYQTPVNVFPKPGGYVIALTYGADSDWVKNVLAAQGCELRTRGRRVRLHSPCLYQDETRRGIRFVERRVLGLLHVSWFLELREVQEH
jgi:deazaflavin-dependent oxidoreductase (nitroreductase family)